MPTEAVAKQESPINQPLETFIQIGLAALLVICCLLILRPFIPLIMWGIIIAIASYPTFLKLERLLGGRRVLSAVLWTLLLLAVLIVPLVLLSQSLIGGVRPIVARIRDGSLVLPPPPAGVKDWPLIGAPLARFWSAASSNLSESLLKFAPQIKSALPGILAASASLVQLCCSSCFPFCFPEFSWQTRRPRTRSPVPWRFDCSAAMGPNTRNSWAQRFGASPLECWASP